MDSKQGEKDFNFQLIAYVREHDELYNPNNPNHKDNTLKISIYKTFADDHGVDTDFVARRWANLRNSYVRIKRERRTKPYKTNNSWAYLEMLKFLDPILSTYSSAPSYSHLASINDSKISSNSSQACGLKAMMETNESIGSDFNDAVKMENNSEDMLFTQSLTYFENGALNNGTDNSNDNDLHNSNDFNPVYDNGDNHESLLNAINFLNNNMKKLIGQQQQQSKNFIKLSQFISEQQQNNHLVASQSDQAKNTNLTNKVSIFLEYSLKPLLETVSDDPIKFAKLQTKITQVVIDELESQKNF